MDDEIEVHEYSFLGGCKEVLINGPLNILLICIPFALMSHALDWSEAVTFILALLALAPIAERLGFVTEQLAIHTNDTIGGLLNATFGNATELIVAIAALSKGLYRLVQLSLLGSILSNMLLVLGCSFFFGGLRYKVQKFNVISSQINATLLIVSTAGVMLPTILTMSGEESVMGELGFSRFASIFLFISYFAFLYFQLISHTDAYAEVRQVHEPYKAPLLLPPPPISIAAKGYTTVSQLHSDESDGGKVSEMISAKVSKGHKSSRNIGGDVEEGVETIEFNTHSEVDHSNTGSNSNISNRKKSGSEDEVSIGAASHEVESSDAAEDDEEEDEDVLGMKFGLLWLGVITVFVTVLSEIISVTIEKAASSVGISAVFLSAIILPIVGNAAEHAGAVMFAMKGKVDLSLGVAIGSSTQIALLVLPLLVLLGWAMEKDMSLNFGAYESGTLILSVVCVTFAIKDGTSNWLLGFSLIIAYIIMAIGFAAHKNASLTD